jgi:hypothetical protein
LLQVQGVWSTSYIPRGTRFGPLVGEVYAKDAVPKSANRKYFWRVSFDHTFIFKYDAFGTFENKLLSVKFCVGVGLQGQRIVLLH